ncbi:MAG: DNA polymerase III subunit [Myxococcales bacterium]|nr:DNA polymerase III subunit [Myxococcales bacterium]
MSFEGLLGQPVAARILTLALERGQVHHAYRFEGPDGVGKERAAFALAQALVCSQPTPRRLACGSCSACRRASSFSAEEPIVPLHPDVILVARGLYSKTLGKSESNGISVQQIREVVLSRAGFSPHEGQALVFIIRDAHELTLQAANALLKTLEEPPPATHFILLTDSPGRMLDTIRSRTLAVRFGPLPDSVIARILEARGVDAGVARFAGGSASRALDLSDVELSERRAEFVENIKRALQAPDLGAAISGLDLRNKDRRELRQELAFLGHSLAERARVVVSKDPAAAEKAARRYAAVTESMAALEQNASPALTVESLIATLRRG